MIVQCPHCGKPVPVKGTGRKPLGIPVKKVCDALKARSTVSGAAVELNCSRAYIYKTLKDAGLTVREARG
jgi:hypothetical protein